MFKDFCCQTLANMTHDGLWTHKPAYQAFGFLSFESTSINTTSQRRNTKMKDKGRRVITMTKSCPTSSPVTRPLLSVSQTRANRADCNATDTPANHHLAIFACSYSHCRGFLMKPMNGYGAKMEPIVKMLAPLAPYGANLGRVLSPWYYRHVERTTTTS